MGVHMREKERGTLHLVLFVNGEVFALSTSLFCLFFPLQKSMRGGGSGNDGTPEIKKIPSTQNGVFRSTK